MIMNETNNFIPSRILPSKILPSSYVFPLQNFVNGCRLLKINGMPKYNAIMASKKEIMHIKAYSVNLDYL